MTDQPCNAKHKWWQLRRRCLRVTAWTIFVLLILVSWWLGQVAKRANQQRQVVEWIEEMGGGVQYESHMDTGLPPGPDWLRNFIGIDFLANVESVHIHNEQVRDIAPLAYLTKLKTVNLAYTRVHDVTPLANLKKMEHLNLHHTQVSDVTPLANLTNLRGLYIHNARASKENCDMLRKSLPMLHLNGP